jgi:hypothetical protein
VLDDESEEAFNKRRQAKIIQKMQKAMGVGSARQKMLL